MALHLLCLVGILLGPIKIQAQDSLPTVTLSSPLNMFPLQQNFQYSEFQGKWYILALGVYTVSNTSQSKPALQRINFELNDDNCYNITIVWSRNFTCIHDYDALCPTEEPGLFIFINRTSNDTLQTIHMKVLTTDYNHFAMVSYSTFIYNIEYVTLFLYGRTKKLNPEMTEQCRSIARSLSLPAEFIFTDLIDECTDN